ncbi:hypothetical protein HC891_22900 [Candidatus Gracilibacteria bacterium]|nr:hypothetical protein [Candidatus Gracilibacteria bacterium]
MLRFGTSGARFERALLVVFALAVVLSGCGLFGNSAEPTATPSVSTPAITISSPPQNATVSSPFRLSGTLSNAPASASLNWRLFSASGDLLAQGNAPFSGPPAGPFSFDSELRLALSHQHRHG